MKVGLFFGSFNPVHVGHLIIVSYMVDYTDLDEVWFVVSPQNPLKQRKDLLNEYERLELLHLATADDPRLKVSDIEFYLPRPSYTINTLLHLEEKFPGRSWALIMGTDTVKTLPKWKNYEEIVNRYEIKAYPRPGEVLEANEMYPNVEIVENVPLMEISASFIRQSIKKGYSAKYLLTEKVNEYIEKWGFYK